MRSICVVCPALSSVWHASTNSLESIRVDPSMVLAEAANIACRRRTRLRLFFRRRALQRTRELVVFSMFRSSADRPQKFSTRDGPSRRRPGYPHPIVVPHISRFGCVERMGEHITLRPRHGITGALGSLCTTSTRSSFNGGFPLCI